ncbi:phosphoribosylanthranilate isomerase [Ruminococcus sp.]|uniref:phosphoribosylanthranilate isomerase n=1 Tax=Ruminococcus sp. TaxID=41978 RepID=UPI003FD79B23
MTRIKICGMLRVDDILYVNKYRPDYAGFILSEGFKRTIGFDSFCELDSRLDKDIKRVGVFVNEPTENILKYYADKLDVIQLHGEENAEYISQLRENCGCEIWKAGRAKCADDIAKADALPVHKLLIDSFSAGSYGGTGKRVDLDIFSQVNISKPFFLAGGLNEENVCEAIEKVRPYGVDFSSSVETDGWKDEKKIKRIVETIRK